MLQRYRTKNHPWLTSEEIQRASTSLRAEILVKLDLKPHETGLLIIDTQDEFCNSNHHQKRGHVETEKIAQKIGERLKDFRRLGVSVYIVNTRKSDNYGFKPQPEDSIFFKTRNGAFSGSDLKKKLIRDGKKSLIVCGFNLSSCVHDTVQEALKRTFNVVVANDLIGNDRVNIQDKYAIGDDAGDMIDNGAVFMRSERILAKLCRGLK